MTKTIKIGIVEDETIIAQNIEMVLLNLGYNVLPPCFTYSEGLKMLQNEKPDLVILDIQLAGKKTGIDLAKKINEVFEIPFIFLSSNADAATIQKAKEVNPPAYLVKPFNKEDLFTAIEIAIANHASKQIENLTASKSEVLGKSVFVKNNKCFYKVDFADITHVISSHIYVEINTVQNQKFLIRSSLANFAKQINHLDFVQTHRSTIVNLNFLELMENDYIVINQHKLLLSKKYKIQLLDAAKVM